MNTGALLTFEQAERLAGKVLSVDNPKYFSYGRDEQGNFYLPEEVILDCDRDEFLWVKDLPIVQYQEV